jgi:hypothetical protein
VLVMDLRRRGAQPRGGDDPVLVLAEHVLDVGANARAGLPKAGSTASAA